MPKSLSDFFNEHTDILAYLQIILACIIWGSYGLFVQILPYPPELIVFFRFLFGAISLIIIVTLTGNLDKLKPSAGWKTMVIISAINSLSWLSLSRAITYTSVANGFILYYTAPCFVVMLAPFFLKEKIEKKSILALAICFIGIVFIMGNSNVSESSNKWLGNILGLISGITYAIYVLGLKSLPQKFLGLISNVYLCVVISLISFPLAFSSLHLITLSGLLILISLGITIQCIATTLYMIGLRKVKAQHASILSYSEALFAMLFATVFLNEKITVHILVGAFLIISGGLIIMKKNAQKEKPSISAQS